jgi:hypothetical protein
MKKAICILILICLCIVATNAEAILPSKDTTGIPEINLESTNLEYRLINVQKDKVTNKIINIRNNLDEPLEIKEVRSTCECIEVKIKPQTVKVGDIMEAEIIFDSTGINQEAEEVVYILTSSKKYELIRFAVLVEIEG